jgi:hypothetical protein
MLERAAIPPRAVLEPLSPARLPSDGGRGCSGTYTDHGTRQATAHLLNVGVDNVGDGKENAP